MQVSGLQPASRCSTTNWTSGDRIWMGMRKQIKKLQAKADEAEVTLGN